MIALRDYFDSDTSVLELGGGGEDWWSVVLMDSLHYTRDLLA